MGARAQQAAVKGGAPRSAVERVKEELKRVRRGAQQSAVERVEGIALQRVKGDAQRGAAHSGAP